MKRRLWSRWKAIAHGAAAVQSNVVLWLLYYLLFLPIALLQRPFTEPLGTRTMSPPAWGERDDGPQDETSARRQF